jgi:hypothetical protein
VEIDQLEKFLDQFQMPEFILLVVMSPIKQEAQLKDSLQFLLSPEFQRE